MKTLLVLLVLVCIFQQEAKSQCPTDFTCPWSSSSITVADPLCPGCSTIVNFCYRCCSQGGVPKPEFIIGTMSQNAGCNNGTNPCLFHSTVDQTISQAIDAIVVSSIWTPLCSFSIPPCSTGYSPIFKVLPGGCRTDFYSDPITGNNISEPCDVFFCYYEFELCWSYVGGLHLEKNLVSSYADDPSHCTGQQNGHNCEVHCPYP